ncbi:hypothetical protein DYI37_11540 [Fulvimarina endophytica]|uniref:Uncharacterized protein n=1 Tax=Fulvimarina endophytica TaxID=2293836 RepID=A0A371X326_9HYPH|nr:hypothetical protein [Fulvimarina endophytica]RFC63630.1 hypothetical protein DYI37_11540 [Fulvimarina endophytica]
MVSTLSLRSQIAEVCREIEQRRKTYPRLVSNGSMRQGVAELHIANMQAVLRTLRWLEQNEATVRDAVAKAGEPR